MCCRRVAALASLVCAFDVTRRGVHVHVCRPVFFFSFFFQSSFSSCAVVGAGTQQLVPTTRRRRSLTKQPIFHILLTFIKTPSIKVTALD